MAIDISSTTRRIVYTGSAGTGPYAFNFEVLAQTDIAVYFNYTELTLTTDYTVTVDPDGTGSVTIVTGTNVPTTPDADDRITIVGDRTIERSTDFTTGGPLFATSLNDEFDSQTIFVQQVQEQADRALRAPNTDPTNIDMTLPNNVDRANKTLAFDSNGNPIIGEQIGDWKGDWAASTSYNKRDLVKDTTTDNVYICIVAHTSSGALPITTNTDSAKWDLVVDAAAAATAQAAAEAAQAAAEAAQAAAELAETNAETAETNAETAETNAEAAQAAAELAQTGAETAETNAETAQSAAEAAQAAAEAVFDNFDDAYLGAKASDPTVDNDGDALADGALYFDTTNNVMKVYDLGTTTWYQLTPTVINQNNINTVAGISADVTTVAGISANVTTVAGIDSDVSTVAADSADISTVATSIANVNTTATNIANVNTVASNNANITTVAGINADVTTTAGISANITTVAGNTSNINTIAGISANVTTVAGIASDVTTAASNVADITNFADVYYGPSASAPSTRKDSSALQAGDLYFNTTDDQLFVWDGSAWNQAAFDVTGAVTSFNTRTGAVTLSAADVNTALGSDAVLDSDIGSTVQAYDADTAKYDDVTANFTGTLQNGGSNVVVDSDIDSTVIGYVAPGSVGNVLTSDGTNWTSAAAAAFDSGTLMLFQQSTAPTGWTKQTTHDNKALRVVSGATSSGGNASFTSAFASYTPSGNVSVSGSVSMSGNIDNTTLSINQIPSHNHDVFTSNSINPGNVTIRGGAGNANTNVFLSQQNIANAGNSGAHNHSHNLSGSLTVNSSTFSGAAQDFAVQYVDIIIASKD